MVTDIGLGVVVAVGVLLGLVAGMVVGWIASRRMGRKDFALQSEAIRAESESAVARLNAELIEAQGQIRVLETDRASLQGEKSSAKSLEDRLEPVREALEGLRRTTQQAEVERAKSAAELRTQIDGVQRNYTSLESATKQLVAAMSSGQSRGQWGEMQLEQLLEHSGLVEGVHFRRQDSRMTEAGGARPDVVVDLPGGGEILIDAKFPFDAYLAGDQSGQRNRGGRAPAQTRGGRPCSSQRTVVQALLGIQHQPRLRCHVSSAGVVALECSGDQRLANGGGLCPKRCLGDANDHSRDVANNSIRLPTQVDGGQR